ncbi:hypothetical protein DIC82_08675 [Clostridium beijerinckii]|nr:hypothetical protein DIC82_08675 [Clostridium beijerinckii]
MMDTTFINYAANTLGETKEGLSGSEIAKFCAAYSIEFDVSIPYGKSPFPKTVPNKRTALYENLLCFSDEQKLQIMNELCVLPKLCKVNEVKKLKEKLLSRYGHLAKDKISQTELVVKTQHWLEDYVNALKEYNSALEKFEKGIYQRNILDDVRLSFELLVKSLLNNEKSLENQVADLGGKLKDTRVSNELRNMVIQIINYYTKYQNNYVKHNDKVNENEIEYVIEQTSIIMKFLIKMLG